MRDSCKESAGGSDAINGNWTVDMFETFCLFRSLVNFVLLLEILPFGNLTLKFLHFPEDLNGRKVNA